MSMDYSIFKGYMGRGDYFLYTWGEGSPNIEMQPNEGPRTINQSHRETEI